MSAADHHALYEHYVALAGAIRVLAYHTGYIEDLASVSLAVLEIANIHLEMSHELARRERKMQLRHKLRQVLMLCILVGLLLGMVGMVTAQDNPPTAVPTAAPPVDPTAPPLEVIPVDQAATQLLALIIGIIGTAASSPATLFISGLLKKIPLFDAIPARTLSLVVAGLLVVLMWVSRYFGFEVQLNSLLSAIQVAGPVILQFVLTLLTSHAAYAYARDRKLPIIGYQRTAPPDYKTLKSFEKGQGLVEYALILVLVGVVVIAVLALLGPAIGNVFSQILGSIDPNALAAPGG